MSLSSRCKRISPEAATRSCAVILSSRGTRGVGSTKSRSYCSNLFSERISITSRNPSVVMKAVFAPRLSITEFVTSVVPCIIWSISLSSISALLQTDLIPLIIAASGAVRSVRILVVVRPVKVSKATSVNVPPISTPIRARIRSYSKAALP